MAIPLLPSFQPTSINFDANDPRDANPYVNQTRDEIENLCSQVDVIIKKKRHGIWSSQIATSIGTKVAGEELTYPKRTSDDPLPCKIRNS